MKKKLKKEIGKFVAGSESPNSDIQLQMAIQQGYVPKGCNLPGGLVMVLVNSGKNPCVGCNLDRNKCGKKG